MKKPTEVSLYIWVLIGLLSCLVLWIWASSAKAHDWYEGLRNPTTGVGCCGGRDCWKVPLQFLSEDATDFIITFPSVKDLPGNAANFVDTSPGGSGLHLQFKFPKSQAMPTPHIDVDDPDDSGFHACIWGGKPRCFFYPTNA